MCCKIKHMKDLHISDRYDQWLSREGTNLAEALDYL